MSTTFGKQVLEVLDRALSGQPPPPDADPLAVNRAAKLARSHLRRAGLVAEKKDDPDKKICCPKCGGPACECNGSAECADCRAAKSKKASALCVRHAAPAVAIQQATLPPDVLNFLRFSALGDSTLEDYNPRAQGEFFKAHKDSILAGRAAVEELQRAAVRGETESASRAAQRQHSKLFGH